MKKVKITKGMTIAEVLKKKPKATDVFMKHGLHCIFCPLASAETVEQGANAHGIDLKKLLKELNK